MRFIPLHWLIIVINLKELSFSFLEKDRIEGLDWGEVKQCSWSQGKRRREASLSPCMDWLVPNSEGRDAYGWSCPFPIGEVKRRSMQRMHPLSFQASLIPFSSLPLSALSESARSRSGSMVGSIPSIFQGKVQIDLEKEGEKEQEKIRFLFSDRWLKSYWLESVQKEPTVYQVVGFIGTLPGPLQRLSIPSLPC